MDAYRALKGYLLAFLIIHIKTTVRPIPALLNSLYNLINSPDVQLLKLTNYSV